jgi:FkbM family methyltransferase
MAFGALIRLLKRARRSDGAFFRYDVRGFKLHLPTTHTLPHYQAAHRLYDRFLGVLGDHLPDDSLVIDIGANIGSSAAALCGTGRKQVICIEGSSNFFQMLAVNAKLIEARGHRITCVRAIVGPEQETGFVAETDSTGKTVLSKSGTPMQSLDEISRKSCPNGSFPILIKIDTDGYDAAVIASGKRTILEYGPLLFWENEILTENDLRQYFDAYDFLAESAYTNFTVFDNFGNIMFSSGDFYALRDVARYIAVMNDKLSTRTVYYVDILASCEQHRELHLEAVKSYRARFRLFAEE